VMRRTKDNESMDSDVFSGTEAGVKMLICHVESVTTLVGFNECAGRKLELRWHANGHVCTCATFVAEGTQQRAKINKTVFLVFCVDTEESIRLSLSFGMDNSSDLNAYNVVVGANTVDLKDLDHSPEFKRQLIELRTDLGVCANVNLHLAGQVRWQKDEPVARNLCYFVFPDAGPEKRAVDAQAQQL